MFSWVKSKAVKKIFVAVLLSLTVGNGKATFCGVASSDRASIDDAIEIAN
ncbi:hypothetical protein OO184_18500 [Photorhabdus sp. APURE]|nr:hypothetical protein [Photorhabdus aballayi]